MAATSLPIDSPRGWAARLDLGFERSLRRTELARRRHVGPLRVQRVFHPEGDVAHVVMLHPPGGLVGGDQLETMVRVGPGASALLTTPAAQKIYRSSGPESQTTSHLVVDATGTLEWLPGETLVFDGGRARLSTHVDLAGSARFLGWEMGCFGRPASDLPFEHGKVDLVFDVRRDGAPLLCERQSVPGGSPVLTAPSGYAGLPSWGTLYATTNDTRAEALSLDLVRVVLARHASHTRAGATTVDGVLVVRALGASVSNVRDLLAESWSALRPVLLDRPAVPPRIWAT